VQYEIKIRDTIYDMRVESIGNRLYQVSFLDHDHTIDLFEVSENLYSMICDGQSYEVDVTEEGNTYDVFVKGMVYLVEVLRPKEGPSPPLEEQERVRLPGEEAVTSPMTCTVVRILVKAGEAVESGQELLVAEAMKLEMPIPSPIRGEVKEVLVKEGQTVDTATKLITLIRL
jgi:biotin carboxyl carrier protein